MPEQDSSRRHPLVIIGGLAFIGLVLAAVLFRPNWFGSGQDSADTLHSLPAPALPEVAPIRDGLGSLAIGSPAPDFTLSDLDGRQVSLHTFQAQPLMLNLSATWCAPRRLEMPEIQPAYDARKADGFVVLALDQDEDPATVREYMATLQLTLVPLMDVDFQVAEQYGVAGIYPTSYFITPDGIVAAVHRGPVTQGQIDDYLKAMTAQPRG